MVEFDFFEKRCGARFWGCEKKRMKTKKKKKITPLHPYLLIEITRKPERERESKRE